MTARPEARAARRAAVWITCGVCLLQVGAGLPAPIYPHYQNAWHLSAAVVTLLFVALIAGVVLGLLFVAPLADVCGRKVILVSGCTLGLAAAATYAVADRPLLLFSANLVQGLAIGAFSGVTPAAITDLDLAGGAQTVGRLITGANAVGLAVGPLWSGLLQQFAPWPNHFVFLVQVAMLCPLLLALLTFDEWKEVRRRVRTSILPRLELHGSDVRWFLLASAAGFCAFALGGLFSSLGSIVAHDLLSVRSATLLGLFVTVLFAANAAAQLPLRRLAVLTGLRLGLVLVVAGLAAVTIAPLAGGVALLLVGTAITGAGQGSVITGGTALVSGLGDERTRAATGAAFFIVCYTGTALPVLATGGVAAATTLYTALIAFSLTIVAAALLIALALQRQLRADAEVRGGHPELRAAAGSRGVMSSAQVEQW